MEVSSLDQYHIEIRHFLYKPNAFLEEKQIN